MRITKEVLDILEEIKEEHKNRLNEIYGLLQHVIPEYRTEGFIFPHETDESKLGRDCKYEAERKSIWSAKDEQKFIDKTLPIFERLQEIENYLLKTKS